MEKQFPDAFKNPIDNSCSTQIQDGMQDILLQPLSSTLTFRDYFDLFWMVKVKPDFHISDTIVIDFDQQVQSYHSAKDLLRYHRDNTAMKQTEAASVTDDRMTLGKNWPWTSSLANCQNKAHLVTYLFKKLLNSNRLLDLREILYVSFKGQLHQVTHKHTKQYPF